MANPSQGMSATNAVLAEASTSVGANSGAVSEGLTPSTVPKSVAEEGTGSVKVARYLGSDSDEVQIVSEILGQSNDRTF